MSPFAVRSLAGLPGLFKKENMFPGTLELNGDYPAIASLEKIDVIRCHIEIDIQRGRFFRSVEFISRNTTGNKETRRPDRLALPSERERNAFSSPRIAASTTETEQSNRRARI